ncbi:unnamed protein product [Chrysoparadoxa australica]
MGAGRVCHDFVQAGKLIPEQAVFQAVGCRSLERSEEFAKTHGIPNVYGSYGEVAEDPEVEICYVGMLHPYHCEWAKAALNAGKHVLPSTCSFQDTKELVELAKAKGLFFMEGMWTRFFPAVEKATELINAGGVIGDIVAVHSDFGFNAQDVAEYPSHQMYDPKLGGGALLYLGPYPIAACTLPFKGHKPVTVAATGVWDDKAGVDMAAAISVLYSIKDPVAGRTFNAVGSLTFNMLGESCEETTYVGTKGRIKILTPAHCPLAMEVTMKQEGRGNVTSKRVEYPLPAETEEMEQAGGFHYPNSLGFHYEALAVHRCIRAGLTYCPQYSPEECVAVADMMQHTRVQTQQGGLPN